MTKDKKICIFKLEELLKNMDKCNLKKYNIFVWVFMMCKHLIIGFKPE